MQYDFNLAPNSGTVMDIAGKFFKYRSGTGVITVRTSKGGSVDLLPGQGVWNVEFTSLTIKDKSGAQNAGVILAGDFDFHDDRITGTVDVVDGGKARSLSGSAFSLTFKTDPAAGMTSRLGLWNPSANKNVVIESIAMSAAAALSVTIYKGPLLNWPAGAGAPKSQGSAAASVAQASADALVSTFTPGTQSMWSLSVAASGKDIWVPKEPIILTPGTGIVMWAQAWNMGFNGSFEWFEEAV